ncbi:hypothetical protein HNQ79_004874 [Streptomyces candidus]|uniref:M23ase beta-sheet core domain-containing protein n=1 Tax=Streptomyces candidus TaxID=67283 RepID=A0A7X0HL27_9ACTN|nr:hypothetical protein [Streptomyces candidus]GHH52165.1 hypothetical protein GCM10018773_51720 [Streptomyces candidus]
MYRLVSAALCALFPLVAALLWQAPPSLGADAPRGPERAWPVGVRPSVVRGWEPPPSPYAAGHRGVDLAAAAGAEVRAAAPGRVSFAGRVAGRGVLSVTLTATGEPPLRTTYEPVRALVAEGTVVTAGQVVAVLEPGAYHCPATGCLHWGLLRGAEYLDPLSLLPAGLLHRGPPRLLPVFGVPPPVPGAVFVPSRKVAALAPDALHALLLTAAAGLAYGTQRRLHGPARPEGTRRAPGPGRIRRLRAVSPGRRAGPWRRRPP